MSSNLRIAIVAADRLREFAAGFTWKLPGGVEYHILTAAQAAVASVNAA